MKPTHHTALGEGAIIGDLFQKSTNYMTATSFSAYCTKTCIDWRFSSLLWFMCCNAFYISLFLSCWAAFYDQLIINEYCIVLYMYCRRCRPITGKDRNSHRRGHIVSANCHTWPALRCNQWRLGWLHRGRNSSSLLQRVWWRRRSSANVHSATCNLTVTGPPTHSVGQWCFARWRLSSSVVVCNT